MSRVIVFVADTKRMTDFYRNVLGLSVIDGAGTGFVILDAGGCQLCLHQIPNEYLEDVRNNSPREDSYVKVVFRAEDIEAEREELLKSGARMKEVVRFGSIALCDGSDPEGNIFQISTRGDP